MGMITKKKEPEGFHDETMRRYDSTFDKKILAANCRKNKSVHQRAFL